MEKSESKAQNTGSGPEQKIKGGVRWHVTAEALIEYVIRANAHADKGASVDDLRIHREKPLYTAMGEDARVADITLEVPKGVTIDGPIGEFFGKYGSIEYKSPGDTCSNKTVLRSWVYTMEVTEEKGGEDLNLSEDMATVIICSRKPEKLFRELKASGIDTEQPADQKGVYTLKGLNIPRTRILVTRELDCSAKGYEWFQWLRTGLTAEEGRVLIRRWRVVVTAAMSKEEREIATLVACTAMDANPVVAKELLEDKELSDDMKQILEPLVQEQYGEEIARAIREKDEAVQEKDEAVQEKDEAVQEKNEAVQEKNKAVQEKNKAVRKTEDLEQLVSALVAGIGSGNIDPAAYAKAIAISDSLSVT